MPDRRESAINDPRFWVSVTAVLLTLVLCALTLAVNKLGSIDVAVQSIRDANTRQGEKIESLERQVGELKTENKDLRAGLESSKKWQTDYNFNLSTRLTEIEVMLKLKGRD
jgi:septal ring factor EnvC (AmiA/AmiB activator)